MKLPFQRPPARCSTCGFLSYREDKKIFLGQKSFGDFVSAEYDSVTELHEVAPPHRGEAGHLPEYFGAKKVQCLRYAFPLAQEFEDLSPAFPDFTDDAEQNKEASRQHHAEVDRAYLSVINKVRECPFWFPYRPGFGPELHRDLEVREEQSREARRWQLGAALLGATVGGLLGAGAAIAGVLLTRGG